MMRAVTRLIAMALWAVAACSDTATVDDACRNLCDCQQPLPTAHRQCIAACGENLAEPPLAVECLECLATLTCDQVADGTLCLACEAPDGPFDLSGRIAPAR